MHEVLLALPKAAPADYPEIVAASALIFGGPYSNLEATRALRRASSQLGFSPDRIFCTGDVVAYGADAAATVAEIRDWGIHVVMGNCEESLGGDSETCGCGYPEGSVCESLSSAWYAHARSQLSEDDRSWMRALPRRINLLLGGRRLALVHGAVDSISRFIFASTPWDEKIQQIALAGCDGIIGGHSGLPFAQIVEHKLWYNAGVIGMPANDGTRRVWFSIARTQPAGPEISLLSLSYDWSLAARKMRLANLPEPYALALETGLWPSCDILPEPELAARGTPLPHGRVGWHHSDEPRSWPEVTPKGEARRAKFSDPEVTAGGERRATVALRSIRTLWFNTGTLCNITCKNCYIDSSPRNDSLAYLTRADVRGFLEQLDGEERLKPVEIGFTGGEPFMNPEIIGILEDALAARYRVLVLTNAMKPMQRARDALGALAQRYPERLTIRVSLDYYDPRRHEELRGRRTWAPAIAGLQWLVENGIQVSVAGRMIWGEAESAARAGYRLLFSELGIPIDASDPSQLVLFPEMRADADVPEITEGCWKILNKDPATVMCASSRMVIKRKGADRPTVVACTLIPYDKGFELGPTLHEASGPVRLNHRYCAQFCVLGGASCSG